MYQEHIDTLNIASLREALKSAGLQSGPITATTESIYRFSLLKYLVGLDTQTQQNYDLNSSNSESDLECIDSESDQEADLDQDDEGTLIPVEQLLADIAMIPRTEEFTPIRWNTELQRYEPAYGGGSNALDNKAGETSCNPFWKWILLMAVVVMFMAIVIAMIFLSGDRDPYKGLEADAANRLAASEGGPIQQ